jgi:dynein intermediate chain, cytosolic
MNFWSFASLREPVETIQVGDSVSCFTVLPETGGILAADDHGGLYMIGGSSSAPTSSTGSAGPNATGNASSSAATASSSRKQIRKIVAQDGSDSSAVVGGGGLGNGAAPGASGGGETSSGIGHHFGVVTALSAKVFKGSASAAAYSRTSTGLLRGSGGLVLSAGVDWTTKLWAPAYAVAAAQSGGAGGGGAPTSSGTSSRHQQQQPLMPLWSATSHSYDYMSDVKWSPVHPGLFATASSNGTLGLWNLASSLDDPLTGPEGLSLVDGHASSNSSTAPSTASDATTAPRGLNKVRWSGDGRRLAVAAGDVMHVLTLHEDVARPKGDEDDRIMSSLVSRGLIARQ